MMFVKTLRGARINLALMEEINTGSPSETGSVSIYADGPRFALSGDCVDFTRHYLGTYPSQASADYALRSLDIAMENSVAVHTMMSVAQASVVDQTSEDAEFDAAFPDANPVDLLTQYNPATAPSCGPR